MNHLPLIIKREYLTKVRNKSFIIMTVLSPIIMIALVTLVAYLSQINNDKVRHISVLDTSGLVYDVFEDSEFTKYNIINNMSLDAAKVVVKEQEDYGLLHISAFDTPENITKGIAFYSEESASISVISDLEMKIERRLTDLNLIAKEVDISLIKSSTIDITIKQENFDGERTSKLDSFFKLIFGGASGYLLFMFIIIYGNMIMRSVIEEKTSRIIEVIISSVKPIQLMLGKIIGTSLAGVTQFAIWIILGGVLFTLVTLIFDIDLSQLQTPQQQLLQQSLSDSDINTQVELGLAAIQRLPLVNLIIAFFLFFISGYLLYSSLYAAIGAAVDSETDTQQFMFPILMPLILSVYVGFFTVIEDPHGTISTLFSFIPFTSPVVMLMRIPFGVPIWQQVVSLIILITTFIVTVWFAAKIYRVGILMYGKKPSYRELLKWMKY
ncbi:ABC transporter permease [Bizionia gelidisalsuginis]|uniref:ABC transporter permease n=2 Tax=Bizionia TaxID=283785 RepID=A0A8H2QGL7_9FLAO|nr:MULTISPECIES: ABC transporter permease [Bizionia]TYB80281.1 ABC transporter permease [Bizionia saleffrena]TYC17123.1 ABC transporter permease [Bizionia gelidisalsuginis]